MLQRPKDWAGTLEKKDDILPNFNSRYIVLSVPVLMIYKSKPSKDEPPIGEMTLTNDAFVQVDEAKHVLAVTPSKEEDAFKMIFRARNNKELTAFTDAFKEAIEFLGKRLLVQSSLVQVSGNIRRGRRTMSIRRDSSLRKSGSGYKLQRELSMDASDPGSPITPNKKKKLQKMRTSVPLTLKMMMKTIVMMRLRQKIDHQLHLLLF